MSPAQTMSKSLFNCVYGSAEILKKTSMLNINIHQIFSTFWWLGEGMNSRKQNVW